MEVDFQSSYLQRLKKRIFIFILPLVIIALTLSWFLDGMHEKHDFVVHTIFPLLNIWFLIVLILLIIKEELLRAIELISFILLSIILLSWFADLVWLNSSTTFMSGGGLGNFSNWTPLFFIYIFLIFNRKKALIISISLYFLSVIIGIAAYPGNNVDKLQALNTLAQFYVSTAAYILALYFLQHLKEAYIQQETMNQAANTDFLTGLPNRRMLEKMVDENRLAPLPTFSVILFDIDLFKEINDTFGHDIGDFVLKEFTDLVRKNTRETDLFGRWGGEEFLIIATHQTLEQAILLAERLKSVFSTHTFFEVSTVTASFGVAEWQPGESKEELLKRADIALYRAKEKGRNLVQAAE